MRLRFAAGAPTFFHPFLSDFQPAPIYMLLRLAELRH
jgi:hypothetical protein